MKFIDFHCDTASLMLHENKRLAESDLKVDIKKLREGEALAQFFALFIDKEYRSDTYEYCKDMLGNFKGELNENSKDIMLCRNINDLKLAEEDNKIGAFLTIEGGDAICGEVDKLKEFKKEGVSLMTLTWNYVNDLGYPNYEFKYKDNGLTSTGIEVIEEMNRLGMLIDVSHLSDGGFYDVIKYSKEPIIASHSNSRVQTGHSRNLTDHMIKVLANNGGLTGINFCNAFLMEEGCNASDLALIKDMVRHIKHIRNVGGIDIIGLGSDFDGIENEVEITDSSKMGLLLKALEKEGFKEEEIEKIFYKNAKRIIKDVLK
ncbi:dipeptidase [Clostridium sp. B9]|uniref:dipeptidase n=1 Tax=Clostridium sp. B9 TaxID=3423224 RepID=UPI003D2F2591